MTITTRQGKGRPLRHTEMDENITTLDNARGVANKAAAVLLQPENEKLYYIGGTDGGLFKGVTGGSGYSDNGGSYCGTQFIPTGGDGSAAYVRVDGGYNVGLGYSVFWFGAVGDGVTDDTTPMQTAHNTGKVISYPLGGYLFTNITIVAGGISGHGYGSVLTSTDTSTTAAIKFTGTGYLGTVSTADEIPTFRDFTLIGPTSAGSVTKTSPGAGLSIDPTTDLGGQTLANVLNVNFRYWPRMLEFKNSSAWTVHNCSFYFNTESGIYVANANSTDVGDAKISDCTFFNGNGGTYGSVGKGVYQVSSGGLKISNTKFNGGNFGYYLDVEGPTSVLTIHGSSFENHAAASIDFVRSAGTANFGRISITGNEFAGNENDIIFDNSGIWSDFTITGNMIYHADASNACFTINSGKNFYIGGNSFNGNGTGVRAITIAAACTDGQIGINSVRGMTSAAYLNSSSDVEVQKQLVTGSDSVTTTTAYGGNFYADKAVTFSRAFESAPVVKAWNTNQSTGGLSVIPYSVTTTGFTARCIGYANSAVLSFNWEATGLLDP